MGQVTAATPGACQTAIVLAAGAGARLYPHTQTIPKPLVEVGGTAMLERLLNHLDDVAIDRVVLVTGFARCEILKLLDGMDFSFDLVEIHNDAFDRANNIVSLWVARDYMADGFLLLEADIVSSRSMVAALVSAPPSGNYALVSPKKAFMSGACVRLSGFPLEITPPCQLSPGAESDGWFKTVNYYRIGSSCARSELLPRLAAAIDAGHVQRYYETVIAEAIAVGAASFEPIIVDDKEWFEVDDINDLDIAEYRSAAPEQRVEGVASLHGGYWRYELADHSLLHNCHYPGDRVMTHLQERLDSLVRFYPSAQRPIASFLSCFFGVADDQLVVGNGASEFIRAIESKLPGPAVLLSPGFNEYDRLSGAHPTVHVELSAEDGFRLNAAAVLNAVAEAKAAYTVIVSPNNPTGNAFDPSEIMGVVQECAALGCRVIVDESFLAFEDPALETSFLRHIDAYPHLVVINSLSKAHGIGGLRLGVLASGDIEFVGSLRTALPIWNINGLAEEYARIVCANRREFSSAVVRVMEDVKALRSGLSAIQGITAYPTNANFVFCRLADTMPSSAELAHWLLAEDGIVIKECSGKAITDADRYFRVASRTASENRRLIRATERILKR